jgi:hypothetical protein
MSTFRRVVTGHDGRGRLGPQCRLRLPPLRPEDREGAERLAARYVHGVRAQALWPLTLAALLACLI